MFKKFKKGDDHWLIVMVILLLCVVIVSAGLAESKAKPTQLIKKLSQEQASKKLSDFLNKAYGTQLGKITVNSINEENGLYKVSVTLDNQGTKNTDTVYMSQDGKLFIPGPQDIDQVLAQADSANKPSDSNPTASAPKNIPKQNSVKVEMFTMSYCPYGNQAEDGIIPVAKLLDKKINIEPHYVIYNNYQGGGPDYCMASGKYCSLHGINELKQDVRELCVYKYQPDKFWDYLEKVDKDCTLNNIETCWEETTKTTGVNASQIKTCLSKEAETLLAKEVELNKKYDVTGSPDIIINGSKYQGGRSAEDFKTAFCNGFNTQPQECSQKLGATSATATGGCGS